MNRKLANLELERPAIEEYRDKVKHSIVVILDDVRSMSNVGSIFRTSDAFCIEELILCGITGTPPHREIQKTALGATESVKWSHRVDIVEVVKELKDRGYGVFSVEQTVHSISPEKIGSFGFRRICLVLGNEVEGVKQSVIDLSDQVIEIDQSGTKHSLNVSVAAGIVLWEAVKTQSIN